MPRLNKKGDDCDMSHFKLFVFIVICVLMGVVLYFIISKVILRGILQ